MTEMTDRKARIRRDFPDSRLTPLTSAKAAALKVRHHDVPEDYLQFLTGVGYGRIGEMRLSIYSGPCEPSDIYDAETASHLPGVLLVADDFQGYCYGYDTTSAWTFGEVNERGKFSPIDRVGSFVEFIDFWLFR
jgi:hypothetical protein